MNSIIIVSPAHTGRPVICRLGDSTRAILTTDFDAPDAFELASPAYVPDGSDTSSEQELPLADKEVVSPEDLPTTPATLILDDEESFNLYRCLHTLYGLKRLMNP